MELDPKTGQPKEPEYELHGLIAEVVAGMAAPNSQRAYQTALEGFMRWNASHEINRSRVQKYMAELKAKGRAPATRGVALAAIRRLTAEAAERGLISERAASQIGALRGPPRRGTTTGRWLTLEEAIALVAAPDRTTLAGMRDRVLIGLLLECGLRREEAAALTVAQVQQRDGRMVLTDLRSKGERIRTVPVPEAAAIAITEWLETLAAQGEPDGALLRQVNKADRIERGSISASAIYKRIGGYAEKLKLDIAPHDLRRSFGKLTKAGGAETEQIMTTLGHASIVTTEIYLGIRQDLSKAPCDFISLEHNSKGKK